MRVADLDRTHLRLQIIGGHLGRGRQNALFAAEGLLDAAVEEEGDVGELLRLGGAQIAQIGGGEHIAQNVLHRLRRADDGQLELLVVLGHAGVVQVLGQLGARNRLVERLPCIQVAAALGVQAALAGEDAGHLAGAVGAEVEVEHGVLVADQGQRLVVLVNDGDGENELILHAVVVTVADGGDGVGGRRALALADTMASKALR